MQRQRSRSGEGPQRPPTSAAEKRGLNISGPGTCSVRSRPGQEQLNEFPPLTTSQSSISRRAMHGPSRAKQAEDEKGVNPPASEACLDWMRERTAPCVHKYVPSKWRPSNREVRLEC